MKKKASIGIILAAIMIFATAFAMAQDFGATGSCRFNSELATNNGDFSIDLSELDEGYFGVRVEDPDQYVLKVRSNNVPYTYWFNDSTLVVPLSEGSGSYSITLYKQDSGDKYITVYNNTITSSQDNLSIFTKSNSLISFNEDSLCVKAADKLKKVSCGNERFFVGLVKAYIGAKVDYNQAFADTDPSVYIPNPDKTLSSGKGICIDTATLAAAMIRSQGIPCKVIIGYTDKGEYHAWNAIYLGGEWHQFDVNNNEIDGYSAEKAY